MDGAGARTVRVRGVGQAGPTRRSGRTAPVARPMLAVLCAALAATAWAGPPKRGQSSEPAKKTKTAKPGELVPLKIKLPKPAFKGTPKHVPPGTNLEKPRVGPRPPLMVPKGVKLVSRGRPVTSSDPEPFLGELSYVTDGNKEAVEGAYVELGPGVQWVQIDLGKPYAIWAIVVWHYHMNARVYHDVIVQVSNDPNFVKGVHTLFNNDHDNSAGLGVGHDKEYWETFEGKLIPARGVRARYVRLYSNGSTTDDQNHYTEVEVYGLPAGR